MATHAPLLTNPPDEAAKISIFSDYTRTADQYLDAYVTRFIKDNKIRGRYEPKKSRKLRMITLGIFALVLLIDIVYKALYHKSLFFFVLVAAVVYIVIHVKNVSMKKYLIDEVKKRPDDDIDNVLVSQVSGACKQAAASLFGAGLVVAVLVASAFLFSSPHIIYEKNEMGGYSVRYYTLALENEAHIRLPETHNGLPVNEIRGEVFMNMDFSAIDLPSGIKEIRGNTFENCRNLKTVRIPEGVTRIGGHAFYGCSALSRVIVPSTVKEIGSSAFRLCTSLTEIRIPRGADVNPKAFKESPTNVIYY